MYSHCFDIENPDSVEVSPHYSGPGLKEEA